MGNTHKMQNRNAHTHTHTHKLTNKNNVHTFFCKLNKQKMSQIKLKLNQTSVRPTDTQSSTYFILYAHLTVSFLGEEIVDDTGEGREWVRVTRLAGNAKMFANHWSAERIDRAALIGVSALRIRNVLHMRMMWTWQSHNWLFLLFILLLPTD